MQVQMDVHHLSSSLFPQIIVFIVRSDQILLRVIRMDGVVEVPVPWGVFSLFSRFAMSIRRCLQTDGSNFHHTEVGVRVLPLFRAALYQDRTPSLHPSPLPVLGVMMGGAGRCGCTKNGPVCG